jgi:hypothetical protein
VSRAPNLSRETLIYLLVGINKRSPQSLRR